MHEGIIIAASGGVKQQIKMDVLANNLANLNNAGFKSDGLVFREIFPPFVKDSSINPSRDPSLSPDESNASVAYVAVDSAYVDHAQGSFRKTGNTFDVALDGEGFFEVETPQGFRYTRNGNFNLDKNNNLVTHEGNFVLGDDKQKIQINSQDGIVAFLQDGTISVGRGLENANVGTISLVKFNDTGALAKEGSGLYKVMDNKVQPEKANEIKVRQGFLERSNVNSIEEMTNMITAIRAFEAYQKVIQTIDEADEAAANAIGRVA